MSQANHSLTSINLDELRTFLSNHKWQGGGIFMDGYFHIEGEDNPIHIKTIVNRKISENFKRKKGYLFSEYTDKLFFPCLIHYLAIIDVQHAQLLLNHYWKIAISQKDALNFLGFIKSNLKQTMKHYKFSSIGLNYKEEMISDWVHEMDKYATEVLKSTTPQIFNISSNKLGTALSILTEKGVLKSRDFDNAMKFFQNENIKELKFHCDSVAIIDLFRRILSKHSCIGIIKIKTAEHISKHVLYYSKKKKKYLRLDLAYLKDGLSNQECHPKFDRLLLNLFPD